MNDKHYAIGLMTLALVMAWIAGAYQKEALVWIPYCVAAVSGAAGLFIASRWGWVGGWFESLRTAVDHLETTEDCTYCRRSITKTFLGVSEDDIDETDGF